MANLITSFRLVLLFLFVGWVYGVPMEWQTVNPLFVSCIFLLDGLDGYVARARNETSAFGASYDIAADRVVENVLWLLLVDIGQAPVWVAIVFLTRGILVDSLRSPQDGKTAPFDTLATPLGLWLTKSRTMRLSYAVIKFLAFGWLFTAPAIHAAYPHLGADHGALMQWTGTILISLAVAMCLLRGLPAIVEKVPWRPVSREGAGYSYSANGSTFRADPAESIARTSEES